MLDDIRRARQSITMDNYIFWDGKIGMQFAEAIAERGRAGVQVKLLLDAFGSMTLGKDIQRTLTKSGGEIAGITGCGYAPWAALIIAIIENR